MRNYSFILTALLLIVTSCHDRNKGLKRFDWVDTSNLNDKVSTMAILPLKPEEVTIDKRDYSEIINLSSIADSLSIIKLETNASPVIGSIGKIMIANNKLYILDRKGNQILTYSLLGEYLTSIGSRGNGASEFIEPTDFDIIGDTVVVLDQFKSRLNYYSDTGKFLTYRDMPLIATGLSIMNSNFYLFNSIDADNDHLGDDINYSLFATDSTLTIQKKGFFQEHGKYSSIWIPENFYRNKNLTYFHPPLSEIIYCINQTEEIIPRYKIDFKEKNLPEKYRLQKNWADFTKESVQSSYYIFPGTAFETDNYLAIQFLDNHISQFAFFNKDSKTTVSAKYINNDLGLNLPIGDFIGCHGNCLITSTTPFILLQIWNSTNEERRKSMFSLETQELISTLNENDNPFLIFIHLK